MDWFTNFALLLGLFAISFILFKRSLEDSDESQIP
jgi:hypothetical protein